MKNEQTSEKTNGKTKTIVRVVLDVIWGIFLILIATFAISNVVAKKNEGIPSTFGTGYMAVLSDSMNGTHEDSFKTGDLVIVTVVKDADKQASNLKVGQIITYRGYVNGTQEFISHRIYSIETDSAGNIVAYNTLGDYYADDPNITDYTSYLTRVGVSQVKGIYKSQIKNAGKVIYWFQQPAGFFVVVVLPTLLFLIFELIQFVRTLMEYKQENAPKQMTEEEKNAEREALKAQLLEELKASMAASTATQETPAATPAEEPASEETQEEVKEETSSEEKKDN